MDWLSGILSIGGSVLGFLGDDATGDAQQQQVNAQKLDLLGDVEGAREREATYTYNAALADQEATHQEYVTKVKARNLKETFQTVVGEQRLAYAKAGVVVDEGTAARMVDDSARRYVMDKELLLQEGGFNVTRAKAQAESYREMAKNAAGAATRMQEAGGYLENAGDAANRATSYKKIGTLLKGASDVYNAYK